MILFVETFFGVLIILIFITIVICGIFISWQNRQLLETVTKTNRGEKSERNIVLTLLKHGIQAQDIFHDLYIEKPNGRFAQVDLAVVTDAGIIVIEIKDRSGWIFGNGFYENWTQVLAYGRQKYRFYNPIRQNNTHIATLKGCLKENVPFYSIIAFSGDCELREITNVPRNTFVIYDNYIVETINGIINGNTHISYSNKEHILSQLKQCAENGSNTDIIKQHIEYVERVKSMRNPQ